MFFFYFSEPNQDNKSSEEENSNDDKIRINHEDDICNIEDIEKDKGMCLLLS